MKKFLKTLFVFCGLLLFLFVSADILSKQVMQNYGVFTLAKQKEILLLGHSQLECDLNDSLIGSSKNLAQGGEAFVYTYLKLKKLLAVNPQITTVLVSFSNNQTEALMDRWSFDTTSMENFYPKYNFMMDTEDRSLFFQHNFSSFVSCETTSVVSNFSAFFSRKKNQLDDRHWGGYLYLIRNKTDSLLHTNYLRGLQKEKTKAISEVNLAYLTKIVAFCKEKKVKLYFIRMPMHPALFSIYDETAFQKIRTSRFCAVPFLDFHAYPATNSEFGDLEHLNHFGAKRFSIFFNALLSKGLLQSATPNNLISLEMEKDSQTELPVSP